MKNILAISLIGALSLLTACSSTNTLPVKRPYLRTQESQEQYYYCESCNKPTPLTVQVYKPLEPDTPIESAPVIKNPIIIVNNTERKPKYKKKRKRKHHKTKPKPIKQCIQWSTQ